MEVLKVLLLSALFSAVAGGNKVKKLKVEIEALESAFATVLEDTEAAIANLTARIDTMEAERVELDKAHAWQALHMAAAAACRGSVASGGTGPVANAVIAKENTRSCNAICSETELKNCDADVSISGYPGQAESYSQRLGYYYNYGCGTVGHTNVRLDEVKADGGEIFKGPDSGNWYYRFCCCRQG